MKSEGKPAVAADLKLAGPLHRSRSPGECGSHIVFRSKDAGEKRRFWELRSAWRVPVNPAVASYKVHGNKRCGASRSFHEGRRPPLFPSRCASRCAFFWAREGLRRNRSSEGSSIGQSPSESSFVLSWSSACRFSSSSAPPNLLFHSLRPLAGRAKRAIVA